MKRFALLIAVSSAVLSLALPFFGGGGPSLWEPSSITTVSAAGDGENLAQSDGLVVSAESALPINDTFEGAAAQRSEAIETAGGSCPAPIAGSTASVVARTAGGGLITGTTSDDLASFATEFNAIRIAKCLQPVPLANFRHDSCMEDRLVWMAEDPSDDPLSAWGHIGSQRSDGVPSLGCDGNLAGGTGDTGASVATKWWESPQHQLALFQPEYAGAIAGICVHFASTHGGIGATLNEPSTFMRATARWGSC